MTRIQNKIITNNSISFDLLNKDNKYKISFSNALRRIFISYIKTYIIDFDQFGFFHPYTVFSLMEIASTKLNRSIRDNLLLADTLYIEDIKNSYKNRVTELEEQLLDYV